MRRPSRDFELGELVGHGDRGCLRPGVEDLLSQRGLAAPVVVDGGVLRERLDQPRDLRAESAEEFVSSDVSVLEHVVHQAGKHDGRWVAVGSKQLGHGDGVFDRPARAPQPRTVGVDEKGDGLLGSGRGGQLRRHWPHAHEPSRTVT